MSEKQKQPGTKKTAGYSLKVNTQHASRRSFSAHQKGTADAFIRDRDQILGSMAFRRLAGKAQVFITGVDDHMRTRLTHTLEVSRIARTIAAPLRLDVDLVEAIALGHDLGHTPFGHVGERTLHEIMTPGKNHVLGPRCPMNDPADPNRFAELQGFKHNLQSLAVAMKLERSYAGFGMDLTNFTLCGMMSHSSPAYKPGRIANHDHLGYYDAFLRAGCTGPDGRAAWSLEGLLVAEADEIAQYYHDVEDALFGGLITPREIVKIMKKHFDRFGIFRGITRSERSLLNSPEEHDPGEFIAFLSRRLVRMLVDRIIRTASHQLNHLAAEHQLNNLNFEEFRARHSPDDEIIRRIFSYQFPPQEQEAPDGFADQVREFQRTITRRVLSSHDIQKADARGKTIITRLFRAYYDTPEQLPDACVYELLSERSVLDGGPDIEWKLRREARKEGVGSIRQRFADLFRDRSDPQLEMLLMRVICNHIAGMTDERARRTYTELCG